MTNEELWHVAARLLGVYLIVEGALYMTGGLSAAGMGLPESSNRLMFVLAPILQGVVSIGAGALLIGAGRRTSLSSAVSSVSVPVDSVAVALQLLGIYYLVHALVTAMRGVVAMTLYSQSWLNWGADVSGAALSAGIGVILIARPGLISRTLEDFRKVSS